jgi:uncharacterized membrane protein YjgN (DUF898 family)
MAQTAIPIGRRRDGSECHHEGESLTHCTQCWTNLRHVPHPAPQLRWLPSGARPGIRARLAHWTRHRRRLRRRTRRGAVAEHRNLRLQFHGCARDYFRIWTVNLCLTLLTVGVFSAWAKVRRKRYIYSSTTLDGTPFQYLGQPGPILKGRVVAAILFSLYYTGSHFLPSLLPYVIGGAAVLAPWVVARSAAFNARYSAFRHLTFRFDGTYWDTVKALHAWGLIPAYVLGTMVGWFGDYRVAGTLFAAFALAFPYWQQRLKRFVAVHTSFGGRSGELSARGGDFFWIYFSAAVGGVVVFVVVVLIVVCVSVLHIPYTVGISTLFTVLAIYGTYIGIIAYVQAHITNLVWNHARLGPLRFRATLSHVELTKLYLTNALAVVGSLGLLIPWAVIRTTKYRIERLAVVLEGDLAEFQGSDTMPVPAVGVELGGFFDLDLSL